MDYTFPKVKMNEHGLFGPTQKKHFYNPAGYHNKTAASNSNKSKWKLRQGEQYEVFRLCDEGDWSCKKNNGLFSILANGEVVLGVNEERLSFFPTPKNTIDPWHGYPVSTSQYEPSSELVDKWVQEKIIDQRISIKILRGQL